MTPTEQDKELRSSLEALLNSDTTYMIPKGVDTATWYVDNMMGLITADRKRVELEARINELNKIALDNYRGKTVSEATNWQAKFEYFMDSNERRIAKLKAQQEEV